ncbi:iron dicitrate transport regulator FecR [Altericroceibacterium spongiae]|uniref:Iron dicitrate transport regulator FecR n=1 Tax=Altericroceibacterium spongiae TaxID=2320269 RepID=A0A420EE46_9SPHN|nr:FecR domain-containing protein [Altericroceibacterium spongiae]RKF18945.1 iron dicitrate transport regulator FecR [Altericroceibacterium spongiae]
MAHDNSIREEAIGWAVRTGDPAFADWDDFTEWLERNPAHAAIYDSVMAQMDEAAEALPALPAQADNDEIALPRQNGDPAAPATTRRRWLGGGIALALVAALGSVGLWQMQSGPRVIETGPGEIRMVDIDDGSRIALAGDSAIRLDADHPRQVTLERGQALFTVRHDASRPFEVAVGADRLRDLGTVFDVRLVDGTLRVAVSEGAVMFNPDEQKVPLSPGQQLTSESGSAAYRVASIPLAQVGEWREGRLTFSDAPLRDVAADLSRATGQTFTVTRNMAGRRISGSVLIDPVREDPESLGPLLGVKIVPAVQGWSIQAP